jgi:Mn2+/Fe2+ NRAMP family transporter
LQLFLTYDRYARYLKWMTLVLLAYVAVLFVAHVDWISAVKGFFWPDVPLNSDSFTVIVAILGTTISPYLLFWQSAQEVEELENSDHDRPLLEDKAVASTELRRIRIDTFFGMAISNVVAIAIIMSTAATLHANGKTHIGSVAEVAEALRPLAGDMAFVIFSLGIIGTGLLSLPVLAGSAAYAVGEAQGWKSGLAEKPWEATGFYAVIAVAFALGLIIGLSPVDPISALFWSAVVNGVTAVPIMAAMMIVARRRDDMGRFTIGLPTRIFGWMATVAMGAAAVAMFLF